MIGKLVNRLFKTLKINAPVVAHDMAHGQIEWVWEAY